MARSSVQDHVEFQGPGMVDVQLGDVGELLSADDRAAHPAQQQTEILFQSATDRQLGKQEPTEHL